MTRTKPHFIYSWAKQRPVLDILPFPEGLLEEAWRDAAMAYVYRANGREDEAERLSPRALV